MDVLVGAWPRRSVILSTSRLPIERCFHFSGEVLIGFFDIIYPSHVVQDKEALRIRSGFGELTRVASDFLNSQRLH